MRMKLIACEIFHRELSALAAVSPHTIDLEFVPKGLHDMVSAEMRERLQARVDAVEEALYERILLGYGLCNNGLAGVRARGLPLVLPRSHDCIGLLVGGLCRYREVFDANPGAYFLSPGWIERGETRGELRQAGIPHRLGLDRSFEDLAREYGEENARYIVETLGDGTTNYSNILYIRTGVAPDAEFEAVAKRRADEKGWRYAAMDGDLVVLRRLVSGPWDDGSFVTIPPGGAIVARADDRIVEAASG